MLLIITGLTETFRGIGLNYSGEWSRLWPSAVTLVLMAGSAGLEVFTPE